MQTISGVLDDGREVIGVVKPGKYPGGGSVLIEERHLVDKPQGLDWDKAAMLPFLVRKPALFAHARTPKLSSISVPTRTTIACSVDVDLYVLLYICGGLYLLLFLHFLQATYAVLRLRELLDNDRDLVIS